MKLSYGLTIEQTQKLTMTPELIQAIRILQFNTQELDDYVQGELLDNPVLEYDRTADIDTPREKPEIDLREKLKEDYDDISYRQWEYSKDKETFSYEQFVSKEETLEDFLLLQLLCQHLALIGHKQQTAVSGQLIRIDVQLITDFYRFLSDGNLL